MRFYTYGNNQLVCETCKDKDLEKTESGDLAGDEAITEDMVEFAGNHGQCDNCHEQCDDYPDCENS